MGFKEFIRERKFLANVSPSTLEWYKHSFKWLDTESPAQKWLDTESPAQEDLKAAVLKMRESGLKATGCNSAIRALNAYAHWTAIGSEAKCSPACKHPKIPQLKEPDCILPTFSEQQIRQLMTWKPKEKYQRRTRLIALFLFDTGARITEALTLHVSELDFDNLLATLNGKGAKQRIVPFSLELRRVLYTHCKDLKPDSLVFSTRSGTMLNRRNVLRDVKRACNKHLGFDPPGRTLHAARHTFGSNYIRRGGNVFALHRVMGHADLETTKRYVHLDIGDLQASHERLTPLKRHSSSDRLLKSSSFFINSSVFTCATR